MEKLPISKGGSIGAFWVPLAGWAGARRRGAGFSYYRRNDVGHATHPISFWEIAHGWQPVKKRRLVLSQKCGEPVLHEHAQVIGGKIAFQLLPEFLVGPMRIRIAGVNDEFLHIFTRYGLPDHRRYIFPHDFRNQPDGHCRLAFDVAFCLSACGSPHSHHVALAAYESFSGVDKRLGQRLKNALVIRCEAEG